MALTAQDLLFECVQKRMRPEDVADLILNRIQLPMRPNVRRLFERIAAGSLRQQGPDSSMPITFAEPVGLVNGVKIAALIFGKPALSRADCQDPQMLRVFIDDLSKEIAKPSGKALFKRDKMNRAARREAGVDWGRRAYSKRFRILNRLERKLASFEREREKVALTRTSKTLLATSLDRSFFGAGLAGSCFMAYYAARKNRRSEFLNTAQDRALDHASDALLKMAMDDPTTNWYAIAHLYPVRQVLSRLSEYEQGHLLGKLWDIMTRAAALLNDCVEKHPFIDFDSMVVSRGIDSSTWNLAAGAWNQARQGWISVIHEMSRAGLLDVVCPGKAMRLMAADVAFWHQLSGGSAHPDVAVWRRLPKPWDVIQGRETCTRRMIGQVCREEGVDPDRWLEQTEQGKPVPFRPTPELVHGVAVSSPALAATLRKAGVFSGKPRQARVPKHRKIFDALGFVLGVRER